MRTLKELSESVILLDDELPFIIQKNYSSTDTFISGNVFGNYNFLLLNATEIFIYIANNKLLPDENLGKLKIVCRNSNGIHEERESVFFTPLRYYIISRKRFESEKKNGAFESRDAWNELRSTLEAETNLLLMTPFEREMEHPKLKPTDL